MNFIINDNNVVMNPIIVFEFKLKNSFSFKYYQLSIAKSSNSLWNFGYHYIGGGSAICNGIYKSEDEAIEQGINFFKNHFKKYENIGFDYKKDFYFAKNEFHKFINRRLFVSESKTKHLQHTLDNGKNYIQTTLKFD